LLKLLAVWLIIGALPQLRADAAARGPQIRGRARERIKEHGRAAREDGRRKPAEWYGWALTAALLESGRAIGYIFRSAWHGWGGYRRQVQADVRRWRAKNRAKRAGAVDSGDDPHHPTTPPPSGGPPPHDHPTEPSATAPGEALTAPPGTTAGGPAGDPAATDNVRPFRRRPETDDGGEMTTATGEATNLEMAVHVADALIAKCAAELDAATHEKGFAEKDRTVADTYGGMLAQAGITGPVLDALAQFSDAVEQRIKAAEARIAAADSALQAARKARAGLKRHESAADALNATGGAANRTSWYTGAGGTAAS